MDKVIAFSLYGSDPKYCAGALINIALARRYYPGWQCWFYVDSGTVPREVSAKIGGAGGNVIMMPHTDLVGKMRGYRFLAAADDVECMISRDTDSRLNPREAAAVDEWLRSGKSLHNMRDHEHHCCHEIYGGMWGIRGGLCSDMHEAFESFGHWDGSYPPWRFRITDMAFLTDYLWPRFYPDDILQHADTERCKVAHERWDCKPFPEHEPYDGFVGEVIMPEVTNA